MKSTKKARLQAAGWAVGTADQLLGLSKQESEYVELKLALAEGIRLRRQLRHLTQSQFAKLVGSSQSRVAKMGAPETSCGTRPDDPILLRNREWDAGNSRESSRRPAASVYRGLTGSRSAASRSEQRERPERSEGRRVRWTCAC